jgi:hypothetical protein
LRNCPALASRRPEVINFGVSGYGTGQELLLLRQRVWNYAPDVVLLAFTTGNDIRNNSRRLEPERGRPFMELRNGRLEFDFSFRASPWFQFKESHFAQTFRYPLLYGSRVLQMLGETLRIGQADRPDGRAKTAKSNADGQTTTPWDGDAEAGLDSLVYVEPRDPDWADAWNVTEALIEAMQDDVKAHGATFVTVTLTSGPQVFPDAEARRRFASRLGVANLFYPDMRIRDLGARRHFPVVNLAPTFQEYADGHRTFLHGFANSGFGVGHWNVEGHRLAGEVIAQEVCRLTSSSRADPPGLP